MIGIIKDVHPLILDTIIVSVFVLIIFFGIIRGIKKTLVNLSLLVASILLGFTSIMNSVKGVFATQILKLSEWVPSGSDKAYKVAATAFTNFLSSLCVFVLIYAILHVISILFGILRKNKKKDTNETQNKSAASRAFGAIVSFVYQGVVVIFIMLFMNNNLVGMNSAFERSTIAKFVVKQSNKTLNGINEGTTNKMLLKVVKGEILIFYLWIKNI